MLKKRRESPLAIEQSTGLFSQISASRCAAHEIWSHVFAALFKSYKKQIWQKPYPFFGGHEGSLLLLSKAPLELSPKFPQAAARHAKFGATCSTPSLINEKNRHSKSYVCFFGGHEGSRTLDLCNANAALSQLSYAPLFDSYIL